MVKAAFIGLGSMGSMLVGGFLSSGGLQPSEVVLSTRTKSKLGEAQARWPGILTAGTNAQAAGQARHVFLCVKPADVKAVLEEISPSLCAGAHIVSIAGTVPMAAIEDLTGHPVTKAIPTVASEVGGGVSLLCHGKKVQPEDAAFVEGLFRGIGGVRRLPEEDLDMGVELTSCMPGFIASIFQEIVESALRHSDSIGRADAEQMVLQTLLGTARLLAEKCMGFDEAIERVATKGGITEEGVKVLRAGLPPVYDEMFNRTMEKRNALKDKVSVAFLTPK
jgi:pyrroline-5-carboxylate reductase